LITASLAVAAPASSAASQEQVIQIEVLIEGNQLAILSMQEATSWTKELLPRKPQLNQHTWQGLDHDQSELLVVLYDDDGKPLRTYAYPGRYVSFLEAGSEDRKSPLQGGFSSPSPNVRMLYMSVPSNAVYVLFFRTEVRHEPWSDDLEPRNRDRFQVFTTGDAEGFNSGNLATFGWTFMGKCPLPKPPRDRPPRPPGPPELPRILRFRPFPPEPPPDLLERMLPDPQWWRRNNLEWIIAQGWCSPGLGQVTGHEQLLSAVRRFHRRAYNIAIFGDGFREFEMEEYQTLASSFVDALQTTPPFSQHLDNINVWRIDTECLTSGVANCPGNNCQTCPSVNETPNTYYKISGCTTPVSGVPECIPTNPGYLGPTALCPFDLAAFWEIPGVFIDLRFVIANCPCYGGAAYPADRLVVVATCQGYPPGVFKNLALHESAHAVGFLCDEYWGCVKWEGESFPNFATLSQVQDDEVPWKDLEPTWKSFKHILGSSS